MPPVALGVGLPLDGPVEELLATAQLAEDLGYRYLWATDDRLQRDPFSFLAAAALRTERILVGPGVTNPYTRHPALVAAAVATLDELSGGRAVLGLGAGGTAHGMLGVDRTAPARALREAVGVIRGLLAGSEQTLEGRVVRVRGARLDFEPPRAAVPILVGARGPRILEVAGEVADGVIVGNVATVEGWRLALRHVSAGARRAGRPQEVPLVAWLYCAVDEDPAAALDAVRPLAATSLVTSRPVLADLGVEMPPAFAEAMEAVGWSLRRDAVREACRAVPDEVVGRFALAGRPEECRERLAGLLREVPGISQVAVVPVPTPAQRAGDVIRRFAEEVAAGLAGPAEGGGAGDG